jgi:hypothetical protein
MSPATVILPLPVAPTMATAAVKVTPWRTVRQAW